MGQKSNTTTLRKNFLTKMLNNNNRFFLQNFVFIQHLQQLLKQKNIFLLENNIEISANKIYILLTVFILSRKSSFLKKKKLKRDSETLSIKKLNIFNFLLKNKLKYFKVNLLIISIKILNKEINKKLLLYFYKRTKKYINILFQKRLYLFIDFLKLFTHFYLLKINLKSFLIVLSEIFCRLHKKSHYKYVEFLNILLILITRKHKNQQIRGFKITLEGRLRGKMMASKILIIKGLVPAQTLQNKIDFEKIDFLTTYGVYGIKAWIYKK